MITKEQLKHYLYLPNEVATDDAMIEAMLEVAKTYVKNATEAFDTLYGENEDFTKQADLFILLYTAELYQNRNQFGNTGASPSFMVRALAHQLQTYSEGGE